MATRDELHLLVDLLPDSALETVAQVLSVLYGNPKIVPPRFERTSHALVAFSYEERRSVDGDSLVD